MRYVARVKKDGRYWLINFPDAEGCVTFAETESEVETTAREALLGWLKAELAIGNVPPAPRARMTAGSVAVEVWFRVA